MNFPAVKLRGIHWINGDPFEFWSFVLVSDFVLRASNLFEFWCLIFGYCLRFVIWCLRFSLPPPFACPVKPFYHLFHRGAFAFQSVKLFPQSSVLFL